MRFVTAVLVTAIVSSAALRVESQVPVVSSSDPWSSLSFSGASGMSPVGVGGIPSGTLQGPAFHAGAEPLAMCFDSGGAVFGVPTLYVVDLYDGNAYLYDANDLSLLGTIPTPTGASVTTGLTTDGSLLYWAADDTLYTSAMDGTALSTVGSIALPLSGSCGDLARDDLGQLWVIDVINDYVSAHDSASGAALGDGFGQPSAPGAFGNGLAFRDDCGAFELLHGVTAAGQVTHASLVNSDGVVLGSQGIFGLGPFVNGVAAAATSPAFAVPSLFVVDNASGAIFEIEALDPCPTLPSDCHAVTGASLRQSFSGFPTATFQATPGTAITSLLPTTTSTISVTGLPGLVQEVSCSVEIDHTWIGDLDVTLRRVGAATIVHLHDSAGVASDDIVTTFDDDGRGFGPPFAADDVMQPSGGALTDPGAGAMSDFDGLTANGPWRLAVTDNFGGEDGTLTAWSLEVQTALAIPDANPLGVSVLVDMESIGDVADLDVTLGIDHPAPHELSIELVSPTGTVVVLETAGAPTALLGNARFDDAPGGFNDGFGTATPVGSLSDFDDDAIAGMWELRIVDSVAGNTGTLRRAELLVCPVPCSAPAFLACSSDCATGGVDLTWSNSASYDSIDIYRDGSLLATLPGTDATFLDSSADAGQRSYDVVGRCAMGASASSCSVLHAPYGGEANVVVRLESPFGDIDSASTLAADLASGGQSVLMTETLQFACFDSMPSSGVVWVCAGTFPDNYVLSIEDGETLADLAAAGTAIYFESADAWGFDPATSFAEYDGVEDGTATDGDDSFVAMDGASHNVLALAGTSATYDQDQSGLSDYTDRILPTGSTGGVDLDTPGAGAGSIWLDASQAYVTGTFYVPPSGARVLAQSWEFGGYGGDRVALATSYRTALSPAGGDPLFERGNANTSGGVDISDAVFLLSYLFILGADVLPCFSAADGNDDGTADVSDAVYILGYLFVFMSPPMPSPFPGCGTDPTPDSLDCLEFIGC